MDTRKAPDAQAVGLMLLICLSFGLQQVAIKAAADDVAPVLQVALRSGVGAALVLALGLLRRGAGGPALSAWRPGLLVGALFALEYLLLGEALRETTASRAVVFLYTAPAFAALGLHWALPSERLGLVQWIGVGLAFAGIAVAFLGPEGAGAGGVLRSWRGDLLALLAGAAWGATTVVIRTTRLSTLPADRALLYQLLSACVLLSVYALLTGQVALRPTPIALASLAFQAVVVSFLAFLVWFWLLRRYQASRLGVLSFMTPLFGVVLGAWLLGEPLGPGFLAGAALVLAGITLAGAQQWAGRAASAIRTALQRRRPDAGRCPGQPAADV